MSYRYKVTFDIAHHPEGITQEQLPESRGACDSILVATIKQRDETTGRVDFAGIYGETGGAIPQDRVFAVWIALAGILAVSHDDALSPTCRFLASHVAEVFNTSPLSTASQGTVRKGPNQTAVIDITIPLLNFPPEPEKIGRLATLIAKWNKVTRFAIEQHQVCVSLIAMHKGQPIICGSGVPDNEKLVQIVTSAVATVQGFIVTAFSDPVEVEERLAALRKLQ